MRRSSSLTVCRLVGVPVAMRPRDRPPAPPGEDADPKEYPWYFEWSSTMPDGDRRAPISGGWSRERLVGVPVAMRPRDRPPAPPGEDADPKEYAWYFEWSRTMPGGDRRAPISGGWSRERPLFSGTTTRPSGGGTRYGSPRRRGRRRARRPPPRRSRARGRRTARRRR